jgi:hypothetical protein
MTALIGLRTDKESLEPKTSRSETFFIAAEPARLDAKKKDWKMRIFGLVQHPTL